MQLLTNFQKMWDGVFWVLHSPATLPTYRTVVKFCSLLFREDLIQLTGLLDVWLLAGAVDLHYISLWPNHKWRALSTGVNVPETHWDPNTQTTFGHGLWPHDFSSVYANVSDIRTTYSTELICKLTWNTRLFGSLSGKLYVWALFPAKVSSRCLWSHSVSTSPRWTSNCSIPRLP